MTSTDPRVAQFRELRFQILLLLAEGPKTFKVLCEQIIKKRCLPGKHNNNHNSLDDAATSQAELQRTLLQLKHNHEAWPTGEMWALTSKGRGTTT